MAAALFVLLACTLLAPSHKRQVAIATFVVGAIVAGVMGLSISAIGSMLAAVVGGALALWAMVRRLPSTVNE